MGIDWLRWYHGTTTDPKWRVVARKTGAPIPAVVAIWASMMENASANAGARGALCGWHAEDVAAAFDLEVEQVIAVHDAMQGKTLDGNLLTAWEKRNPKREREDNSTERVRKHRDSETPRNAKNSLDKIREEESRKEEEAKSASAFAALWELYPKRVDRKEAERHFRASVKTPKDLHDIQAALQNYIESRNADNSRRRERGDSAWEWRRGGAWFNNWRDWIPAATAEVSPAEHAGHFCVCCRPAHEWACADATCDLPRDAMCNAFLSRGQLSLGATP